MTFVQLYGTALDTELGSADRTKLFTAQRRKDAINEAQREFVRLTECLVKQGTIPIVSGTGEYDLEASFTDYTWLAKDGVVVKILLADGVTYRYLAGNDLPLRTVQWLDREMTGWRSASAGTPIAQYVRDDGGTVNLGLTPAPSVAAGETWTLLVPYVMLPTDMVLDGDLPFTVSANAKLRLWPWHKALAHYASAQLQKLRKNWKDSDGVQTQTQLFAGFVADYLQRQRPKGGQHVSFEHNYRATRRGPRQWGGVNVNRDFY